MIVEYGSLLKPFVGKSANYTTINEDKILITKKEIIITLPTSPTEGDWIIIGNGLSYDENDLNYFYINPVKIFGEIVNQPFAFNKFQYVVFVYQNSTVGWVYYDLIEYMKFDRIYFFMGGTSHTIGVNIYDGSVWSCGSNQYGQLGDRSATTASKSSPVSVRGGINFSQVRSGSYYVLGIRDSDGSAWSWGYNNYSQLGDGTTTAKSSPVSVLGGMSFTKIATGQNFSTAIRGNDGTCWSWGYNIAGQLGDMSRTNRNSPVSVRGGFKFSYISNGVYNNSLGIRESDGSAWAWGSNTYGQLGDGTTTDRSSPVSVRGGISFKQVSSGYGFVLGIRGSDGSAWAWGYNAYGQLGDGTTTDRSSPVSVLGGISFKQIFCGYHHCLGIRGSDGSAWSWGLNNFGQLGVRNVNSYSSPVSVHGGLSFTNIGAGDRSSFGLIESDGSTWGWGQNDYGQLGNNTRTNTSSPVLVYQGLF